jgi:hypothetical protein
MPSSSADVKWVNDEKRGHLFCLRKKVKPYAHTRIEPIDLFWFSTRRENVNYMHQILLPDL